jgi:pimeloyl-ACP methyl ester carboxylesterase
MDLKPSILNVPGGRLYHEVRGTGPVLLMIPGGPTDAGIFGGLAACLMERYTVVTYDPRGNSRSVLDDPEQDQDMDLHGDDAAGLLAAVGGTPAYVLGSSGGAQIGLNLVARHPGRVRTLVAHEPPCVGLLPDAAEQQAAMADVQKTYRTQGVGPAMQKFEAVTGMANDAPRPPPPLEMQQMAARIKGNIAYFLGHGVPPISSYLPDVEALRAGSTRIVVGIGTTSAGQLAHRTALALAGRLGVSPVTFPGGHTGFGLDPAGFARTLDQALRDRTAEP